MSAWDDLVESCKDAVGRDVNDINDVADVVDELNREVCRLKQDKNKYSEEDMIGFADWLSKLSFNLQNFEEKGLKPFNELLPVWNEWNEQVKNK
jgi:hypothetical protein